MAGDNSPSSPTPKKPITHCAIVRTGKEPLTMTPLQTIKQDGFSASLYADEDATSPADWDQLGTLYAAEMRYGSVRSYIESVTNAADNPEDAYQQALEAVKGGGIAIGLSFTSERDGSCFPCAFEPDCDGYAWVTADQLRREYSQKRISAKTRQTATDCLKAQAKAWDQWVSGQVYWYSIEGPDGFDGDSLCGLYGYDYAVEEMTRALNDCVSKWHKDEAESSQLVATGFAL